MHAAVTSTFRPFFRAVLLCLAVVLPVGPGGSLHAAVFGHGQGEGEPADDRIVLGTPAWQALRLGDWVLASGTLHCNGALRGSAVILAPDAFGPVPEGLVLVTAAHVLFDLERGGRFGDCDFHYLGLGALPGYQAKVDLATAVIGPFDPAGNRQVASFGRHDWAFLHVPEGIEAATEHVRIQPVKWEQGFPHHQAAEASLLAWSEEHDAMAVTPVCRLVVSRSGDLGGGAWPGQLLDDCDSGQGASGGGLVAFIDGVPRLVGIRTGSHWDGALYPAGRYPEGPPPGEPWDVNRNTNFARSMDAELLAALQRFLKIITAVRP